MTHVSYADRAVHELCLWNIDDPEILARLLRSWAYVGELTDQERADVVDAAFARLADTTTPGPTSPGPGVVIFLTSG